MSKRLSPSESTPLTIGTPQPDHALAEAETGTTVRIATIRADAPTSRHLAALGLRAGIAVAVIRNLGADGVVLGLGEDRLALPRELAEGIRVETARAPSALADREEAPA